MLTYKCFAMNKKFSENKYQITTNNTGKKLRQIPYNFIPTGIRKNLKFLQIEGRCLKSLKIVHSIQHMVIKLQIKYKIISITSSQEIFDQKYRLYYVNRSQQTERRFNIIHCHQAPDQI